MALEIDVLTNKWAMNIVVSKNGIPNAEKDSVKKKHFTSTHAKNSTYDHFKGLKAFIGFHSGVDWFMQISAGICFHPPICIRI